jgi:hypothetical protein
MVALLLQFTTFTDQSFATIFSKNSRHEFALYMASLDLIRILRTYDVPGHRVLIWYPRGDYSLASLSFLNLGNTLHPPSRLPRQGCQSSAITSASGSTSLRPLTCCSWRGRMK